MKGILLCRQSLAPWFTQVLDRHPLLFPLPGTTVLDHLLGTLRALGAQEIRILSDWPGEDLEKALIGQVDVSVRYYLPTENTLFLLAEQRLFLADNEALLLQGPSFNPPAWFAPQTVPSEWMRLLGDHSDIQGVHIRHQGTLESPTELQCLGLSSPSFFFRLVQNLLPWSQAQYQDPVFTHSRIQILPPVYSEKGNRVDSPNQLGPSTWLDKGTRVRKDSTLQECLLLGGVDLPAHTHLSRKMVTPTHLIHGETGEILSWPEFEQNLD